jgi:DNA-binding transcriptional MerR regulator
VNLADAEEFISYLRLQDEPAFISKSELLQIVRSCGFPVSDRQLTTYVAEGLLPKSARIGLAGAYPEIVGEYLVWISRLRRQGISLEAIKELAPLWRHLKGQIKKGSIDLWEFERFARECVHLPDAALAVPFVLDSCLTCGYCLHPNDSEIKLVQKDGSIRLHNADEPATVGFIIADRDEDGKVYRIASTARVLPSLVASHAPSTVILGIPNEVDFPSSDPDCPSDGNFLNGRAEAQTKGGARERGKV